MTTDNTTIIPSSIIQANQKYTSEDFSAVSKGSSFLRRLQLFGANADAVKKGIVQMATWGIVTDKQTIDQLPKEVDMLVCTFRPRAMRMDQKAGTVETYFTPTSPEFQKIVADSETPNSGCTYGPEFLFYYPANKEFITYYMGSKTARNESGKVRAQQGGMVTLKIKLIEAGKYAWHGPVATACSTPPVSVPDEESLKTQLEKFNNPKDSEVETVETDEGAEARPQ